MHSPGLFDDAAQPLLLGAALGLDDGDVVLHPRWMADADAASLFALLEADVPWKQEHIRLFGATHAVPRLTAWYGEPGAAYVYSGLLQVPAPWLPELARLRQRVEAAAGHGFNSMLANLYRDGDDAVAWHADDEPELGAQPVIASLSLGATRRFRLRARDAHERQTELDLHAGDLLLMRGSCQARCEHTVPRTRKQAGPRINLTFRNVRLRPSLRGPHASG